MKIDKKLIKELVENLKEFRLTELEYQEGQTKIKVSIASKAVEQIKTSAVVSPNKSVLKSSDDNAGVRVKSPIIVIGSSPTALVNLLEILKNSKQIPSLIIGMPVGFIGVQQSKEKLINTNYPRIVVNSSRGGAAMAAAAVNALLRETI